MVNSHVKLLNSSENVENEFQKRSDESINENGEQKIEIAEGDETIFSEMFRIALNKNQVLHHQKYLYDDADGADLDRNSCIEVSPLPFGFYEEQLYDFFGQISDIRRMRVERVPKSGKVHEPGLARIDFKKSSSAQLIVEELKDLYIYHTKLSIRMWDKPLDQQEQYFKRLSPNQYRKRIKKGEMNLREEKKRVFRLGAYKANRVYSSKQLKRKRKQSENARNKRIKLDNDVEIEYLYQPI